ncbi:MAG: hypothetical protein AAF561_06665 [Planctomycetota bacterium]
MHQSNRLLVNALVTYGRMALTVGVGLYTTRLVVDAMGIVDYGLYSVLGASVGLMAIIDSALTASVQRHLSFELGRGDASAGRAIFSTALAVFAVAAVAVFLLGQLLATPILAGLDVPAERERAAAIVYQVTLAKVVLSLIFAPFQAAIVSRQAFVVLAVFSVAGSLICLAAALSLGRVDIDSLVLYPILLATAIQGVNTVKSAWAFARFPEARPSHKLIRLEIVKEFGSFATWQFVGSLAPDLRQRGGQIALNVFFGPVANAGFAIARDVLAYARNLSNAILRVVSPAMATAEGSGNRTLLRSLAISSGKLSAITTTLLTVPLILVAPELLDLWLDEVPQLADVFVPLFLLAALIDVGTSGMWMAIQALGKIGQLTRIMVFITLLPVPVSVGLFLFGLGPVTFGYVALATSLVAGVVRVTYVGRRIDLTLLQWLRDAALPVAVVAVVAGSFAAIPAVTIARPGLQVVAVFCVYGLVMMPTAWFFGLTVIERDRLRGFAQAVLGRVASPRRRSPA